MKEMVYQKDRKIEVLDTGEYLGFTYYIMNLGTHPTAYIKIPETHKYFNKDYHEIDLEVHEGLTYSKDYLYINENEKIEGWFIGWDYAHYRDYLGYKKIYPEVFKIDNKKWTTKEIKEEVVNACKQLLEE